MLQPLKNFWRNLLRDERNAARTVLIILTALAAIGVGVGLYSMCTDEAWKHTYTRPK